MSLAVAVAASSVLASCAGTGEAPAVKTASGESAGSAVIAAPPASVVLVVIDGMRPDYYTRADAYGLRIPALRALMARGRYAEGMLSVFPSVTYPAHTTMVTGTSPRAHGISTNLPFDPWMTNAGGWNWYAESIKTKTLWTAAHEAGDTTAAIFWPVTVGAAIDYDVPQLWRQRVDEDLKLLAAVSSPRGFARELATHASLPAEHRSDKERGDADAYVLREKKPALALMYFADLDTEEHRSGPASPEVFATLEGIDAQLGRLVEATVAAHTYETTTFLVVSDHGFLPVSTETRPAAWLAHEGLITRGAGGRVTDWQAQVLPAGGSCGIVLRDPKDAALVARVDAVLTRLAADPANGIAKVDREAELVRLGGYGEATFALEAARSFEFVPGIDDPPVRPSGHKGTHGYSPEIPEMHASFIAAGPGIHRGPPLPLVRMIDLAPTVARILHLDLPNAEGRPIAELF
jgi:predicted AlkP superfamily pyrophosphatase or phosphodiesterase